MRRNSSCLTERAEGVPPPKKIVSSRQVATSWRRQIEIQENRIEEGLGLVAVGSLFIKAAIRTNLRTKRNMDIEMTQFRGRLDSVLDLHKYDYNPASCSELS